MYQNPVATKPRSTTILYKHVNVNVTVTNVTAAGALHGGRVRASAGP